MLLGRIALVAVVLATVGVLAAGVALGLRWLRLRAIVTALETRDSGNVEAAIIDADLDRAPAALLRLEGRRLLEALSAAIGSNQVTSIDLLDPRDNLQLVRAILRAHPELWTAERARLFNLDPLAFRALLELGRPDLACPGPRAEDRTIQGVTFLEFSFASAPMYREAARPLLVVPIVADGSLHLRAPVAGTAVIDLGPVPLESAAAPPAGAPGWIGAREDGQLPAPVATPGHTYVFRSEGADLSVTVAFTVLATADRALRLRWRLLESRVGKAP